MPSEVILTCAITLSLHRAVKVINVVKTEPSGMNFIESQKHIILIDCVASAALRELPHGSFDTRNAPASLHEGRLNAIV